MAARFETEMLFDFYESAAQEAGVKPVLPIAIPEGVSVQARESEDTVYYFIMNFNHEPKTIQLPDGRALTDMDGKRLFHADLDAFDVMIAKERIQ